MSRSDPGVYERGRGMDAHNQVMRDIRARNDATYDPHQPTRVWIDEDLTPDGIRQSLTIILNTGGCRWARAGGCTMCGYVAESVDGGNVGDEALLDQLEASLAYERETATDRSDLVKIYTSGSFLDEREIGPDARAAIAEAFADRERIVIESLPDFVTPEKLYDFLEVGLHTDVAMGLETATDRIRRDCVNKYFAFDDFVAAADTARSAGAGVKAYLLCKPPFVTEPEAVRDMIASIRRCARHAHTISMNPTNVQKYTLVDELYFHGGYRPPWLWSIVAILDETADVESLVVSDPVGHGSDRGPHNCGECDERVTNAIADYSRRQDPSVFEQVSCACRDTWELVMERERGYNLPLLA